MTIRDYFDNVKYLRISITTLVVFLGFVLFIGIGVILSIASFFFRLNLFYNVYLTLILVIGLSFFISFLLVDKATRTLKFICPNCYEFIFLYKINNIMCPDCKETGKTYKHLFTKCSCNEVIRYYDCPHCKKEIDLLADYNYSELMRIRNEK